MKKKVPTYYELEELGVIPVTYGLNIEWTNKEGCVFRSTEWEAVGRKRKRAVRLEVTSYRGVGIGARHFYGKLKVDSLPSICIKSASEHYKVGKVYGYGSDVPRAIEGFRLSLYRLVTRNKSDERFRKHYGYRVGGNVDAFETISELVEEFHRIHKLHFPKWRIEVDENAWSKALKVKQLITKGD